jgi:aryl sulfotransferase
MNDIVAGQLRKTRELQNHHMDSTLWNDFQFRDDDIIVATYAKSGTTWTQQIVGQLVYAGDPEVAMGELSPWWDMRILPPEVREQVLAFRGRRILKTHLPLDALELSPRAKYLYVGRDGRDICFSLHNHHLNHSDLAFELLNNTPGRVGPEFPRANPDVSTYFDRWLATDGGDHWSLWENIRTWWAARVLPNVKLVHFANLKADLEGQMREIADFLEIDVPADKWPAAVEHCTFDWMKAHAALTTPGGGMFWEGGGATFLHKGTSGQWRDVLTPAQSAAFEAEALKQLGPECAHWLATGEGA